MHGTQPSPFAAPGGQPPPPVPPRRKHTGGRHASPEAEQTVLRELGQGESVKTAADAAGVDRRTVRRIWERHGHTWPPPGLGKRASPGGRPSRKLIPGLAALAAKAIQGGEAKAAVARDLGVSRSTLYRALGRLEDGKP